MQILGRVVDANPMTWFVELFRSTTYGTIRAVGEGDIRDLRFLDAGPGWPDPGLLLLCAFAAVVVFALGYTFFNRLALTFAKEV